MDMLNKIWTSICKFFTTPCSFALPKTHVYEYTRNITVKIQGVKYYVSGGQILTQGVEINREQALIIDKGLTELILMNDSMHKSFMNMFDSASDMMEPIIPIDMSPSFMVMRTFLTKYLEEENSDGAK
jgi:hypothetical protein